MKPFANGKQELARVNDIIQQLELPEFTDSCVGSIALSLLAMCIRSPQDELYRLQLLIQVIAGKMQ